MIHNPVKGDKSIQPQLNQATHYCAKGDENKHENDLLFVAQLNDAQLLLLSMCVEHRQQNDHMQYIRHHQPNITNVLKWMTFTLHNMCNELVHPADDDVDKVDGDDGGDLPWCEFVVTVAEVEDNGSDNQFRDSEHEVMCEISV